MLIKFIKPDPRAGSIAQMDSRRGQQFIEEGAAEAFSDAAKKPAPSADQVEAKAEASKPAKKAK